MCGYENLIYGMATPGLGGTDGVRPGDERLSTVPKGDDTLGGRGTPLDTQPIAEEIESLPKGAEETPVNFT